MTVSFERRDGRISQNEYRVVVTVGDKTAAGAWSFTKADARRGVEALRRSLFDADEAERRLADESNRRGRKIRESLAVDRRPSSWGL